MYFCGKPRVHLLFAGAPAPISGWGRGRIHARFVSQSDKVLYLCNRSVGGASPCEREHVVHTVFNGSRAGIAFDVGKLCLGKGVKPAGKRLVVLRGGIADTVSILVKRKIIAVRSRRKGKSKHLHAWITGLS